MRTVKDIKQIKTNDIVYNKSTGTYKHIDRGFSGESTKQSLKGCLECYSDKLFILNDLETLQYYVTLPEDY